MTTAPRSCRWLARLNGASAALDVAEGKGRVVMLLPEVTQRGQSHGSFKLMFNSLLYRGAPGVGMAQ